MRMRDTTTVKGPDCIPCLLSNVDVGMADVQEVRTKAWTLLEAHI